MRWLFVIGFVIVFVVVWWRLFRAVMPFRNDGDKTPPPSG